MLQRLPTRASEHAHTISPVTLARLADDGVTLPTIIAWILAQPVGTVLVTPDRPCLVATALTAHLRDAVWNVRVRTSYHVAFVRDDRGWLLAQPWLPGDVCRLIQLLDAAAQQNPAGTLSRERCLLVLGQLTLHEAGGLP